MPIDRVYSAGDRVVFLARGNENHISPLQNFGPQHFLAGGLQDNPFIVAEGVVTDVNDYTELRHNFKPGQRPYANSINVRYQAEDRELYVQDFTLKMRQYTMLEEMVQAGFNALDMPMEQREWLSGFIYPMVVTSQGYNKLLTDLLMLVRPDAEVGALHKADTQEIVARCERYGIRYSPINRRHLFTKWALEDRVEDLNNHKPQPVVPALRNPFKAPGRVRNPPYVNFDLQVQEAQPVIELEPEEDDD